MEEDVTIKDYYVGLQKVIEYFTRCWRNNEGEFTVKVSDDKGTIEWSIKGGHTERSSRLKDGEHE